MARLFISFLGTGSSKPSAPGSLNCGYEPVTYATEDKSFRSKETPFAQVAEIQWLGAELFDRVIILCTDGATGSYEKHFSLLKEQLIAYGTPAEQIEPVIISSGTSSVSQWSWFETLLNRIGNGDRIVLDMTHGFRSVQIILSASIGFLERAKQVTFEHILYGSIVHGSNSKDGLIVDMKEFYTINQWAEGVSRLIDDADASMIARLADEPGHHSFTALRDQGIIGQLKTLTETIRNVDVNTITTAAAEALSVIQKKREKADSTSRILLDLVVEKFSTLVLENPPSGRYDANYFRLQIAIIGLLLDHQLYMQAYTAMRECIGSIGMLGIAGDTAGMSLYSSNGRRKRRYADLFVRMLSYYDSGWTFEGNESEMAEKLKPFYCWCQNIGIESQLREIIKPLLKFRNAFDHAWVSIGPEERSTELNGVADKGYEYHRVLCTVIEHLVQELPYQNSLTTADTSSQSENNIKL